MLMVSSLVVYLLNYKNKNWLQFLFIVKAAVLKQQISKFYPQIQRTEASDHIYFSQRPSAILDFQKLEISTSGPIRMPNMRHRTKLREDWSNRSGDMADFRFFKMAAAAILDFGNFKF